MAVPLERRHCLSGSYFSVDVIHEARVCGQIRVFGLFWFARAEPCPLIERMDPGSRTSVANRGQTPSNSLSGWIAPSCAQLGDTSSPPGQFCHRLLAQIRCR